MTTKSHLLSIAKAISWRILGSIGTVIIAYILTKKVDLAFSIGAFEFVGKIFLYYLHERLWYNIKI